uniref:Uncharacterized protein MANES_17G111900 n=1 Tax=Rhizophora mucronata TaxID=61149 RepID=A0A2P2JJ07_RHIMU
MADPVNVLTAEIVASEEDDENVKFGFQRSEMHQSKLAGTVDPYERHLFLCFQSPDSWLPRVEESETDPLPKLLSSALKACKNDITVKTKLTICEAREGTFESGDVLIFPEMIKYKGLKDSEINGFVDYVLVNDKSWAGGMQEALTGSHVFVCAHASRDKRCGVCGPILIEKLKEGIESRELKDRVFVSACSHVGGHKYAGNLIIYSPDSDGKITGHWYGYVTPDDVAEILDQHIGKGILIERLWRGQMGASTEEGEEVDKVSEQRIPNGEGVNKSKKQEEMNTEANKLNTSSCCQGASGFSCCRDGNGGASEEKKLKEKIEVHGNEGLGKVSSWIGSLEQSDILAAVAVVGAVASVAVAYSMYKRSG